MHIDHIELQALRDRWSDGKYRTIREALEHISPQAEWMDLCDVIDHPVAKRLANDLRGLKMAEKDLKDLDLGDSFLDFSVFDRSKFDGAQFQWSIMNGTSFRECEFHLAQMLPIYGDGTDFRHARFRKSFIGYTKLSNSDFSSVTMSDGDLHSSEMTACNFSGLLAERNPWTWSKMVRCDFVAARFMECELTATRFDGARLINATFENCDLSGVDFRGADLEGVNFHGGTFWSAPEGSILARTKFDDTPAARRVVEVSTAANRDCIEWCPVTRVS